MKNVNHEASCIQVEISCSRRAMTQYVTRFVAI